MTGPFKYRNILQKIIVLVIACCLFLPAYPKAGEPHRVNVQLTIDSLLKALEQTTDNDTARVSTLAELTSVVRDQNTEQALQYMLEAQRIIETRHLSPDYRCRVYFTLAYAYLNKADYKNSLFN